ncbi:MAG: hypothetical protein ACI4J7_04040 [Ruminiclostridium sp.]
MSFPIIQAVDKPPSASVPSSSLCMAASVPPFGDDYVASCNRITAGTKPSRYAVS